jgi:hypothetical protein
MTPRHYSFQFFYGIFIMIKLSLHPLCAALFTASLVIASPVWAQSSSPSVTNSQASAEKAPRKYTFFMHLKTRDAWLQLSREDRLKYLGRNVFSALQKYPAVKMRHFDAESYTARLSDVVMFETTDLQQYDFFIDVLRDLEFWHKYFDVLDIIPAVEGGYVEFNRAQSIGPRQP